MKEGAGEDPFADDEGASDTETETTNRADETAADSGSATDQTSARSRQPTRIPYKFRRESVQDGRDRVPLFLREDTRRAERDALRELEDRFDEDVSLTDLREAVVKAGLQRLDDVEEHLVEWGYGMTFDE